jgi:hypothetical protein
MMRYDKIKEIGEENEGDERKENMMKEKGKQ